MKYVYQYESFLQITLSFILINILPALKGMLMQTLLNKVKATGSVIVFYTLSCIIHCSAGAVALFHIGNM